MQQQLVTDLFMNGALSKSLDKPLVNSNSQYHTITGRMITYQSSTSWHWWRAPSCWHVAPLVASPLRAPRCLYLSPTSSHAGSTSALPSSCYHQTGGHSHTHARWRTAAPAEAHMGTQCHTIHTWPVKCWCHQTSKESVKFRNCWRRSRLPHQNWWHREACRGAWGPHTGSGIGCLMWTPVDGYPCTPPPGTDKMTSSRQSAGGKGHTKY